MRTLFRIAAAAVLTVSALGASAQVTPKYQLHIAGPDDGAIISDTSDVLVRATVVPNLAQGHQVELLVDGVSAGGPSTTLEFPLSPLPRGLRLLQVTILDATGNVVSTSAASTLYVLSSVPGLSYSRDTMGPGDR